MINTTQIINTITGKLSTPQSAAVANVKVGIYDVNLREWQLLAETLSDKEGKYKIEWELSQLKGPNKKSADIGIKVFTAEKNTALFSSSIEQVRFNAGAYEEINVTILKSIPVEVVEYDVLLKEISFLAGKVPLINLQENKTNRDVSFLSKEMEQPKDKIEHFIVAQRLYAISKIDAEFFYALLRKNTLLKNEFSKNLSARLSVTISVEDLPLLYDAALVDSKKIESDLKAAVLEKIISEASVKKVKGWLSILSSYKELAKTYFEKEHPEKTLQMMYGLLQKENAKDVQGLFSGKEGSMEEFMGKIANEGLFSSEKSELAEMYGFGAKILPAIMTAKGLKKDADTKVLASLNKSDWEKEIGKVSKGSSKDLISNFASTIVRKFEQMYPTQAFSAQLKREKKELFSEQKKIVAFLDKYEQFDLQKSQIDLFVKETKGAEKTSETVLVELKRLQRVFKLIPNYSKSMALLDQNIHSAQSIVALGERQFVDLVAYEAGIEKLEAIEIFEKADTIHTAALMVVGELNDLQGADPIASINSGDAPARRDRILANFPDLKTLFKLSDLCSCEHCRSVYSPSAYFVELLEFLDNRKVLVGNAKTTLFERRPDLGDIDLSCANSNVPVKYIDLVCEVLEAKISPQRDMEHSGPLSTSDDGLTGTVSPALITSLKRAGFVISEKAQVYQTEVGRGQNVRELPFYLRDEKAVFKIMLAGRGYKIYHLRQTLSTEEELAAAPEYVNGNAYTLLKQKEFAFGLPFDLQHVESKAYLQRFGVERSSLMKSFKPAANDIEYKYTIAAESIDLNVVELNLISTLSVGVARQNDFWNIPSPNTVLNYLRRVDHFLDKTGITYEELENLLMLEFIKGDSNLFIQHEDLSCDTSHKTIANLSLAVIDRMHRFLRLQKKTNWSFNLLDSLISNPNIGNRILNKPCILKIAQLKELSTLVNLSLEQLSACFGTIPFTKIDSKSKHKSMYHSIFLSTAKNGTVEKLFLPEVINGTDIITLTSQAEYIATSLQIKKNDLQVLIDLLPSSSRNLNIGNLSYLYLCAQLCKKLTLSGSDLAAFKELNQLSTNPSPENLISFVETVKLLKTNSLQVKDVQYLLKHQGENLNQRALSESKITQVLTKLKLSYERISSTHQSKFIRDAQFLEQKDVLIQELRSLPGFTEQKVETIIRFFNQDYSRIEAVTARNLSGARNFLASQLPSGYDQAELQSALQALGSVLPGSSTEAAQLNLLDKLFDFISKYQKHHYKKLALLEELTSLFKLEEATIQILAERTKLGASSADTSGVMPLLLNDFSRVISASEYRQQFSVLQLLQKTAFLVKALQLSSKDLSWYFDNQVTGRLNSIQFNNLPFSSTGREVSIPEFLNFVKIHSLAKDFGTIADPSSENESISFFSILEKTWEVPALSREVFMPRLSLLTGYSSSTLESIDARLFTSFDLSNYKSPTTYLQILECMEYARKMGVSVSQMVEYVKPSLNLHDVRDLRNSLKALYDEKTWLSTLKEIMDVIRPQKRDALVSYILATDPQFKSKNDLYEYFLIDVEMEACMPSSRIVQAQHSVQLFTQRCLMGFEPNAKANIETDPNWAQWKWLKNYRVWEANRKVFLYPENWYDVTLTDDKTFLLDEFISELQQNELNNDTAETALHNYLEKLDNIAFLEVMATWYDTTEKTMHVFARTKGGDPAIYYYRRFEQERYWTPWEKVELDITGDHLLAFKRNGRLCLAWPVFSEEAEPKPRITKPQVDVRVVPASGTPTTAATQPGDPIPLNRPKRKLKIQLAISELSNKKWQQKKVSKDAIMTPKLPGVYTELLFSEKSYMFFYNESREQIFVVNGFCRGEQGTTEEPFYENDHVGTFSIDGFKGYPQLLNDSLLNDLDFLEKFEGSQYSEQKYIEKHSRHRNDLSAKNAHARLTEGVTSFDLLLRTTPQRFRISYPNQLTKIDQVCFVFELLQFALLSRGFDSITNKQQFGTLLPYFFEDSEKAYVIVPGFYKEEFSAERNRYLSDKNKRTAKDVFELSQKITNIIEQFINIDSHSDQNSISNSFVGLIQQPEFQGLLKELANYESLDFVFDFLIHGSTSDTETRRLERLRNQSGLTYGEEFKNLYHPLVNFLRNKLSNGGIKSLMKRDTQLNVNQEANFETRYMPNSEIIVKNMTRQNDGAYIPSYPIEDIDFTSDGSYSAYNWDLFYRVPLHIATSLTKNQRFEEALEWFHYIFNPMGASESEDEGVQRFWVTKPFYQNQDSDYLNQRIDNLLMNVSNPGHKDIKDLESAIEQWRAKPFRPDVVARFRPVAYQKAVLMKYIDNLIEWGDHLFMQDTMESIAQATQLYILADKLLGQKPRIVSSPVKLPNETYNQLSAKIDAFGNTLVHLENILPDLNVLPQRVAEIVIPSKLMGTHYFCIPPNEKMLEYWDRVADRLFKIRHCQNIDGVERSLALFAPPIDPGMLVRATAAGLDIGAVIAGFNTPTPHYRFNVLSQKATELAQEVRGLGNALLQAIEKKDSEALSLLRSELEIKVLNAVKDIKLLQIEESKTQIEVLNKTKLVTEERRSYYETIEKVSIYEQQNLDDLSTADNYQFSAQLSQTLAGALALIPNTAIGVAGFGGSPVVQGTFGGWNWSSAAKTAADILNSIAMRYTYSANRAATMGGHKRREEDWQLQERLANLELDSITKQIAAAEIRKEISETDLKNHELQIENAKQTDEFMRSKFTNKELYDWMIGQISSVYFKSYQLAREFAKKAEKCYRFELGNDDTFITGAYWDSMKKGLQSTDHLIHDIKRMETSYLDKNKREYELTKHISLAQLDPLALVKLRTTGSCDVDIPEALYDMDHPGQYFRRIKSVSVSLPCIAGPYTSVSAKLSLINNRYRKNAVVEAPDYNEVVGNDPRFVYNIGAIQSIATSSAQNDSGVFELNFRDERYLPFEGTGAISSWRLELPTEVKQFDYTTITDVIIHVKYTAREGGSGLKTASNNSLRTRLNTIKESLAETGLHVAIDMKHELTNEWHLLKRNGTVDLTFTKSRLPYMVQAVNASIINVMFIVKLKNNAASNFTINVAPVILPTVAAVNLPKNPELKGLYNGVVSSRISIDTPFTLSIANADKPNVEELMMVIKYDFPS
jgi:hypothetical protein